MTIKIRKYWIKRLEKKNVQRSLHGAASRSFAGRVALGFITKTVVLPGKYDQCKIKTGGAYLEVYADGSFFDDYLKITITGYDPEINAWFEDDAGIKLDEIVGPISVRYEPDDLADPTGIHCVGRNVVCRGRCTCVECPANKELEAANA
ncbi:MAG: hypothetical protein KKC20_01010 [Proteobacteria bacterium]|nr:hypothetical protein [Pseudomonadota bacterium]